MPAPLLLAVMGPTASGKTDLAEALAREYNAQLINADAFQVYRYLDVGTAKSENRDAYELIDIIDPDEEFGVGEWVLRTVALLEKLFSESRNVIVVGGTGFYIRALFEQYTEMLGAPDPELRAEINAQLEREGLSSLVKELGERDPGAAAQVDLANPARVKRALERVRSKRQEVHFSIPPFQRLKIGLSVPKEILDKRIALRCERMVQNGWTLEIQGLRERGYRPEHPGFRAHGYRAMWKVLEGEMTLDEAVQGTTAEVRRYAKRQRTWMRSEPGLSLLDAQYDPFNQAADLVGYALRK